MPRKTRVRAYQRRNPGEFIARTEVREHDRMLSADPRERHLKGTPMGTCEVCGRQEPWLEMRNTGGNIMWCSQCSAREQAQVQEYATLMQDMYEDQIADGQSPADAWATACAGVDAEIQMELGEKALITSNEVGYEFESYGSRAGKIPHAIKREAIPYAGHVARAKWDPANDDVAFEAAADELKRRSPGLPITCGDVWQAMRWGIGPAVNPYIEHGKEFHSADEVVRQ